MNTVSFQKTLQSVARRMGLDPVRNLQANVAEALAGYITQRSRHAWEDYAWPEICPVAARFYRPAWDEATVYAVGQEVWDPASRAYFVSTAEANVGNPPNAVDADATGAFIELPGGADAYTPSAYWQKTGTLERTVLFTQPGFPVIGDVLNAWMDDPATTANPRPVDYRISANGIAFGPLGPDVVWIEYRMAAPEFTATAWRAGTAYPVGSLVYFLADGECYRAVAAVGAGESPSSAAAKWDWQPLLQIFAPFVELAAYADALAEDGQTDKAGVIESRALDRLAAAQDRINVQQRQSAHFSVRRR